MPDRYIWMFLTHKDVSELFNTFSKYTPQSGRRHKTVRCKLNIKIFDDGYLKMRSDTSTITAKQIKISVYF